jgi:hypothetical protein
MKTTYKTIKTTWTALAIALVSCAALTSCEEEDPFVDRHTSPVLIVFDGIPGYLANGGLTSTPTRTYPVTPADYATPADWVVRFYELDKSGILDHTVGIDSIPVAGLSIKFTKRDGTLISELTTNSEGKVFAPLDWTALVPGYDAMAANTTSTINVSWSGEYKGVAFTRYSVVVLKKTS